MYKLIIEDNKGNGVNFNFKSIEEVKEYLINKLNAKDFLNVVEKAKEFKMRIELIKENK